ncbi:hypothetical protein [Microcoleus sp. PH2017_27_LUM_O_A]|uniref:hypothetical protein n=1 Tax=Microcoleus sp. PH2017_27_LUM_O_A TaxID=2798837 RepID=UPI0025D6E07E|nr:hypothetical protein [Microcoleus sp. PH2017_27_LUM_O_A]
MIFYITCPGLCRSRSPSPNGPTLDPRIPKTVVKPCWIFVSSRCALTQPDFSTVAPGAAPSSTAF